MWWTPWKEVCQSLGGGGAELASEISYSFKKQEVGQTPKEEDCFITPNCCVKFVLLTL
jgi:hypothetical protein